MREADHDVIDWAVTPRDELRFAFELDTKVDSRKPVSHEIALVLRCVPPNWKFTVRFKKNHAAVPFQVAVDANGLVVLRCPGRGPRAGRRR